MPNRQELQDLSISLWRESKLDAGIISLLRQAPGHTLPMDVLRTVVSALAWFDPEEKVQRSWLQRSQGGSFDGADFDDRRLL